MARHVAHRDPRAHWVLLLLGLVLLLAALTVDGLVTGLAGGSGAARAGASAGPAVPKEVATGGPVLRLDRDRPASRTMPDRTVALTFDDGPDPRWTPQVL
ncbi:bi-functional transferase/deacetylase, partial [Micromonospora sp. NPDC004336]